MLRALYGNPVEQAERRTMEELLKHLGYATPLMYAAAAYGFFHWLDENASDAAKAALARTMTLFKDYKNEQVASALVEVFDRIYTYPLLRWRAFFRSMLFTTVATAIYLFEMGDIANFFSARVFPLTVGFVYNFFTDYLSLFVIRPLLIRSGTRPVIGLVLGTVSGIAVVFGGNVLRAVFFLYAYFPTDLTFSYAAYWASVDLFAAMPALAVFVWLPLFALGILIARLLPPLSWIVGRTQWFLKEGKEHPLKAIGYVAAVAVFLGTIAGRAVFKA